MSNRRAIGVASFVGVLHDWYWSRVIIGRSLASGGNEGYWSEPQ
jgi:hypothetical protein